MFVKLYDCDQNGTTETFRAQCELIECFPDAPDDPEYQLALAELKRAGRYWVGGGAAPLTLLIATHAAACDLGNAAIPHPNTDQCTAACNNTIPD